LTPYPSREQLSLALQILQEECGEVIVASSKITRFGLDSVNPVNGTHNLDNLIEELGDLRCLMNIVTDMVGIDPELIYEAAGRKYDKLLTYAPTLFGDPE
jgi:NTP pyrophosphatase (non-canonical NTP hydrolase)